MNRFNRTCLYVALALNMPACSTHEPKTERTIPTGDVLQHSPTSAFFVHFGIGFGNAKRLLSARVHLGEPFDVSGEDFWKLTGRIDRCGDEIVANLMGSTGWQGGPYNGAVRLEETFGSQGGSASGGATYMWFGVSTNSDPTPLIKQINDQYRRVTGGASNGETGATNGSLPSRTHEIDSWTPSTNGLQARLTLVERSKVNGTRWLVPYLELRNVRDLANQMDLQCDGRHLKIELVDANGKVIREGWSQPRSGPTTELSTVSLPWDSSMRISLECKNWGVPKNASAMIATDSGAWVVEETEKGMVYLRATLRSEKSAESWRTWSGTLQTPLLKIDWK